MKPTLLHPRNRHRGRYDFPALLRASPALAAFARDNGHGETSIDFAQPAAVKALNRALLASWYGIAHWDIPDGYLCPPIPGRADYVHGLADLLALDNGGDIPRGPSIRVLDIGVGANVIYPLIGHGEYGWRFVGSDIDPVALKAATSIVTANALNGAIELRLQAHPVQILRNLVQPDERFDLSLCNPPFHASAKDAAASSQRKWRNLGKPARTLNFGGQGRELWCKGGEAAFIDTMIAESRPLAQQVLWFSTLVSRVENLPDIQRALQEAKAEQVRITAMAQGQKQSRFIAWTFLDDNAHRAWNEGR
jgi:23S rRNA (adenine1618-N6)-methyltransferase